MSSIRASRSRAPLATLTAIAVALGGLAACGDTMTDPAPGSGVNGVVVLNGFGQQGVTLVPDSGTATSRIDFGASYDGGGMALLRDTVISTSSKAGGDLLYVA